MIDKNGRIIESGNIVRISGGYFKADNGLYFVAHSPGDPTWFGKNFSLRKLNKNGTLSNGRYNINSWPLSITVNDWQKRAEAHEWNREHAEIEVLDSIPTGHVAEYFREQADAEAAEAERLTWLFGPDTPDAGQARVRERFLRNIAEKITDKC